MQLTPATETVAAFTTSQVQVCGLQSPPQVEENTCLFSFASSRNDNTAKYSNIEMSDYRRHSCARECVYLHQSRKQPLGVRYTHGGLDIYISKNSQETKSYNVMIISKPLCYNIIPKPC